MFAIPFDPSQHNVQETPFGRFLQSHFRDPLIFTYKHMVTGNWVVAAWTGNRWDKMLELAIMGKAPVGNPEIVRSIETMVRGNPQGERNRVKNRDVLRFMEKRADEQELQESMESADAMDFLQKRVKHETRVHVVCQA